MTNVHVRLHYIEDLSLSYLADRSTVVAAPRTVAFDGEVAVPEAFVKEEGTGRIAMSGAVVAEACFVQFNRGSGREHPALDGHAIRSLSMGDVVEIVEPAHQFWLCESVGFAAIEGVASTRVWPEPGSDFYAGGPR